MQVNVDVKCMHINFGGHGYFWRYCYFQKRPNFPLGPWSLKNLIDQNWLKKFMQVGIDVKCMCTNFGGRGLSGFGDTVTLKNGQISLSDHGL